MIVGGGRLAVNGRLGGTLSIGAGGMLGGTGTVGAGAGSTVTVRSGGALSPGNSIGTLTIDGNLIMDKGSRFVVETNPDGSGADLVRVTGNATLNGGSVMHVGADGNYGPRSTYRIMEVGGLLSGRFDAVSSDFAFLAPSLDYDYGAGSVSLRLERNESAMALTGRTRNQRAAAGAIDGMGMASGHAVYDAVVSLPDDPALLHASFDQLSGEVHASAKSVLLQDSRYLRDAVGERLRSAAGGVGAVSAPVLVSAGEGARLAPANANGPATWIQGMGSWSHIDSDGNAARVKGSTGGFLMSADAPVSDAWRLGVMAGYSRSDFDVQDRASSGDSDNYHLGAYAGGQWGALGLRGGLAYSWHDITTRRSVAMRGFSDRLKANYDGRTAQAFAATWATASIRRPCRSSPSPISPTSIWRRTAIAKAAAPPRCAGRARRPRPPSRPWARGPCRVSSWAARKPRAADRWAGATHSATSCPWPPRPSRRARRSPWRARPSRKTAR